MKGKSLLLLHALLSAAVLWQPTVGGSDNDTNGRAATKNTQQNPNKQYVRPTRRQRRQRRRRLQASSTELSLPGKKLSKPPLNILALGGSTTWGARLDKREYAYPNLLGKLGDYKITNKAIRATDAHYPSLCIQSMLSDGRDSSEEIEYDIIMFEYSINGPGGIDTLVKRLQYRYPDAILIYVHFYSLLTAVVDSDGHQADSYKKKDRAYQQWHWKPIPKATQVREPIQNFFDQIGGYVYQFIKPKVTPYDVMPLFADDWHHLSQSGHEKVANDLLKLISQAEDEPPTGPPVTDLYDTKWGYGDQCENWFESGKVKLKQTGAKLTTLDSGEAYIINKYVLEFPHVAAKGKDDESSKDDEEEDKDDEKKTKNKVNGGTIEVINKRKVKVPLYLTYMSAHQIYPVTKVTVGDTVTMIVPDRDRYHVAKTSQVGFAEPGLNEIRIEPQFSSFAPFRLVGVVLFGFKYHQGIPFRKAQRRIPSGIVLPDAPERVPYQDNEDTKNAKNLNVLVLGGPQTWGSGLAKGQVPYPTRLGQVLTHANVVNRGIRATDAFYPSICIQTMLENDGGKDRPEVEYDVVLLEYSFANPGQHLLATTKGDVRGFRTLVKRLQYRYPNAVFVYVHLYSLRDVLTSTELNRTPNDEPRMVKPYLSHHTDKWKWQYPHPAIFRVPPKVKTLLRSVGGHVVGLPVPPKPEQAMTYFTKPTWDGLSEVGHRVVGDMIAKLLEKELGASDDDKEDEDDLKKKGRKALHTPTSGFEALEGSWGWGDRCLSWHTMGGIVPLEYKNGVVENLASQRKNGENDAPQQQKRWALVFFSKSKDKEQGTLTIQNAKGIDVPIYLTYLIDDGNYKTQLMLNGVSTELGVEKLEEGEEGNTLMQKNKHQKSPTEMFHTTQIGVALPGKNVVTFAPHPGQTLKVIGLALYGFRRHEEILPMKTIDGPQI